MVVDLFLVYQFIRRLATPFEKWPAYKEGVIDEKGNILKGKRERNTRAEKESFGIFDLMILKLKKLLAKVPGGSSRLASYAAALWLIKEWKHFSKDSMLNESVTDKQLNESLDLFLSRYCYYIQESENVNNFLSEATNKPPRWKRAGPNGEIEIKFPTGRRFQLEKQLDQNERHKGEWKVMEWDTRRKDWEWHDTYKPKWFAKERVMKMGQYDNRGKKVADYSDTFQSESVIYEEMKPHADVVRAHKKLRDAEHQAADYNYRSNKARVTRAETHLRKMIDKHHPGLGMQDRVRLHTALQNIKEEPTVNVGSGNIAGLGVGPQGEPGLTPAQMKRYKKKNKGPKRIRDIIGAKT